MRRAGVLSLTGDAFARLLSLAGLGPEGAKVRGGGYSPERDTYEVVLEHELCQAVDEGATALSNARDLQASLSDRFLGSGCA